MSSFAQEQALEEYVRSLNTAQKAVTAYDEADARGDNDNEVPWKAKSDALEALNRDFKALLSLTMKDIF